MKQSLAAALLSLVALTASAGTITSISPSSIQVNSAEHFITVYGTDLGDRLVFDGPAGHFERDVSATFAGSVVGWVPEAVVATPGNYAVTVTGPNGTSGPATFRVRGFTLPLILLLPEYIRLQPLTREGIHVKYEVFAMGGEDPNPKINCTHESGAFFPMGQTIVTCYASNIYGERAEGSFAVNVRDEEAPIVSVPREPIVVKAQSIEGAFVDYKVWANDDIYGEVEPHCLPRSGSNFPIGITTVQCTATDLDLNVGHASFAVEVIGERKPYTITVDVPNDIVVGADSPEGARVKYEVGVTGTEDPYPSITCEPRSGSHFPIGDTNVVCNVIDAWGMRGSGSFNVRVLDTGFPSIVEFYAKPRELVADGRIHPLEAYVHAVDDIDVAPVCEIFAVTANEPIDSDDFRDPEKYDWRITGPLTLELRAERFGDERIYTVWLACSDYFGNRSTASTDIRVIDGVASKPSSARGPGGKRRSIRRR